METDKRVKLCLCFLRTSVLIKLILEKGHVQHALKDLFMTQRPKNVIGVNHLNSFTKILKTTLLQNVQIVQQELQEDMKMNVCLAKVVEFISQQISLQSARNALQMLYAHLEQSLSSPLKSLHLTLMRQWLKMYQKLIKSIKKELIKQQQLSSLFGHYVDSSYLSSSLL